MLNIIPHVLLHLTSVSRSFCKRLQSDGDQISRYIRHQQIDESVKTHFLIKQTLTDQTFPWMMCRSGGKFWARHCNQWGLYGIHVRQCRDTALFPKYFGQTCLLN